MALAEQRQVKRFHGKTRSKLVLAALYKAFVHTKTKKQDMVQYGKQRSKRI